MKDRLLTVAGWLIALPFAIALFPRNFMRWLRDADSYGGVHSSWAPDE